MAFIKNPKNIKVAVALYGQPSFIKSKLASGGYKRLFKNADVTYFGHTWFDSESLDQETSGWTGLNIVRMHPKSIEMIIKQYPGIKLETDSPRKFVQDPSIREETNTDVDLVKKEFLRLQTTPQEMYSNSKSQLYSISKTLELVKRNNGSGKDGGFDLIFLSRWDIYVRTFPRIENLSLNQLSISNHHGNFPDLFLVGPSHLINATDAFGNFNDIVKNIPSFTPELVKQASFYKKFSNLDINLIIADTPMIRSSGLWYTIYIRNLETKARLIVKHLTNSQSISSWLLRALYRKTIFKKQK